eukprot:Selendium_serpulae@DN10054_c0_g1_i1.p1
MSAEDPHVARIGITDSRMHPRSIQNLQSLSSRFKESEQRRRKTMTQGERDNLLTPIESAGGTPNIAAQNYKVQDALMLLQRLQDVNANILTTEFQVTRQQLRAEALQSHKDGRYADAMLQALHCYELAKAYYSKRFGQSLQRDMVFELLLLSKCCAITGSTKRGKEFLTELRYIIENTILFLAQNGVEELKAGANPHAKPVPDKPPPKAAKAAGKASSPKIGSIQGPYLQCDPPVLCRLTYEAANLLSLFGDTEAADLYYDKYVAVCTQCFGPNAAATGDAYNAVALHYFKGRRYQTAYAYAMKCLKIREQLHGNNEAEKPNPRVAEAYCNVGLLYRLLGKPDDAVQCFMAALDMLVRIHGRRDAGPVQDVNLSIAIICHQVGDFRRALEIYKEVYNNRLKRIGGRHPDTLNVALLINRGKRDVGPKMHKKKKKKKKKKVLCVD